MCKKLDKGLTPNLLTKLHGEKFIPSHLKTFFIFIFKNIFNFIFKGKFQVKEYLTGLYRLFISVGSTDCALEILRIGLLLNMCKLVFLFPT